MENEEQEIALFKELKSIRLEKSISLESIAEKFRVQVKYLELLEDGDLLAIPEVYDKLFFRSYVKALGVDEEVYYDKFIDYRRKIRLDKTTTVFNFSNEEKRTSNLINIRNVFVLLPIVAVILVVWFLINYTEIITSSSTEPVNEIDIREVVNDIEKQAQEQMAQKLKDSAFVDTDTLHLNVNGLMRTWFRVVIDQNDTTEYLLQTGEFLNFTALNMYEFLIGRADGLEFSLNGIKLPALSSDSNVVRYLKIDSTGIATKILKDL